jgi:predicted DNA-binding transcriptional regulator YafY
MPYPKREEQTFRQFSIIQRLYSMERLTTKYLAQAHDVSHRTIQRDMKTISTVFPLLRSRGSYSLDIETLTNDSKAFHFALLRAFAKNIDIDTLCIEKSNIAPSKVAFAIEYNKLPKALGEKIIEALQRECRCNFGYVKPEGSSYREVDPIKLYTENSRWYLIARDYKDDKVKTFNLTRIKQFKILDSLTTLTDAMRSEADNIQSIWSSGALHGQRVILYIKPNIAHYIQDIKLHKTQMIADRHHDGGLEVHCTVTHKLEILPAIKSWLPHVHIIEPRWLWEELMRDLEYYGDEDYRYATD